MSHFIASTVFLAGLQSALGQAITGTFPAIPLASKTFDYPDGIPYQADSETGLVRGIQTGYNICNSTTEGQESRCQTGLFNSLDDFCLWSAPEPNSVVGNIEGEAVAWCTKPGRGARLFPQGALQGVQFMRTPDYVQAVGFIDQRLINLDPTDFGGEMDPHGADLRGNPLGGLVYSNAWSGNNDSFTQVMEWHNFMGGGAFCFKACDPSKSDDARYCEHIFDRIGCFYNAPNNAQNGTFESCEGDNQDFPGIYTENGVTMTYTQPGEGVEPSPPYPPKVPASSNCVTFESATLFAALASVTPTVGPFAPGGASASATGTATGTGTGAANPTSTSGSSDNSNDNNAANAIVIGILSTSLGVAFSVLFLA